MVIEGHVVQKLSFAHRHTHPTDCSTWTTKVVSNNELADTSNRPVWELTNSVAFAPNSVQTIYLPSFEEIAGYALDISSLIAVQTTVRTPRTYLDFFASR